LYFGFFFYLPCFSSLFLFLVSLAFLFLFVCLTFCLLLVCYFFMRFLCIGVFLEFSLSFPLPFSHYVFFISSQPNHFKVVFIYRVFPA
jgi:hypothetical protein